MKIKAIAVPPAPIKIDLSLLSAEQVEMLQSAMQTMPLQPTLTMDDLPRLSKKQIKKIRKELKEAADKPVAKTNDLYEITSLAMKWREGKCREAFEELPEIKNRLSENIVFIGNRYTTANDGFFGLVTWLNGAWYAWQSRQAEIHVTEMHLIGFKKSGSNELLTGENAVDALSIALSNLPNLVKRIE